MEDTEQLSFSEIQDRLESLELAILGLSEAQRRKLRKLPIASMSGKGSGEYANNPQATKLAQKDSSLIVPDKVMGGTTLLKT